MLQDNMYYGFNGCSNIPLMNTVDDEDTKLTLNAIYSDEFYECQTSNSFPEPSPNNFTPSPDNFPPSFGTELDTAQLENYFPIQNTNYNYTIPPTVAMVPQVVCAPYANVPFNNQVPQHVSFNFYDMKIGQSSSESLPNTPAQNENVPALKPATKRQKKVSQLHVHSFCVNCYTRETTLWRRNKDGLVECNACNLYYQKNKCPRPISLTSRKSIHRRVRKRPTSAGKTDNDVVNENVSNSY